MNPPASTLLAPTLAKSSFEMDATAVAPSGAAPFTSPSPTKATTTVLPRIEGEGREVRLVTDSKIRYEPVKLLGTGGMGEVILVRDHDIARPAALKRLLPEMSDPVILARFVDEIRTVGRLEHPNIVPIHDVGVDDLGRYFFVMKYVEGETLESIIAKLRAGDPDYHRTYSVERRIEIFLGVLHALQYAHANGIVHRDIKPANVMVGRYGEVVLMDWGIAKPLGSGRDPAADAGAALVASGAPEGEKERMFATRIGALIGTPAYMSPEQASGRIDLLDARSDLYSAAVLFHELVTLRHYLGEQPTIAAMLQAVSTEEFPFFKLMATHPSQASHPPELTHFVYKGISKDPAARYQSAAEMIAVLQQSLEGKLAVQCHATMTKRMFREMGRFVDRKPHLGFAAFLATVAMLIFATVQLVRMIVS
jgi:eukaryotic-like serine/threonine-protein kinase